MEKFNADLFENYSPSKEVYEKTLEITSKLGKLNVRMKDVFKSDYMKPSRIFAFIESKYSSKIEGVYTTLFDVVNTGKETSQTKLIQPLVNALFKGEKIITIDKIKEIEEVMNSGIDRSKRWEPNFGIYETVNSTQKKIYEPPMDPKVIDHFLDYIVNTSNKNPNILDAIVCHLLFEKLHPFVDANGRIGRLIFNRTLVKTTNFSNVLPVSWSIFKNKLKYYEAFNIVDNESLNQGVLIILDILMNMYETTKNFIIKLDEYFKKFYDIVKASSTRMNDEIATDILLTLQTKTSYLIKKYKLNPRTINSIFEKISHDIDFNVKILGREKLFWNIELEQLIEGYFNG